MNWKMGEIRFTAKEIIFTLCSIVFFFQQYLELYVSSYFSYYDEIISIIMLAVYLIKIIRKGLDSFDKYFIVLLLCFTLFGIIGNFTAKIQENWKPILIDWFLCIKIFFIFVGSFTFLKSFSYTEKERIVKRLSYLLYIFISIAFIFAVINLFYKTSMSSDPRYGLYSFRFISMNPGMFSYTFYFIMFIFTINILYCKDFSKKVNLFFIIIALLTWISTLRTKAFIFAIVYLFLYFIFVIKKLFKFNFIYLILIIAISIYIGYDQYLFYYVENDTARAKFLEYGFVNFNAYFPLGSGFGTFGTSVAFDYYSQLYYNYGMNLVHGLEPGIGGFSSDTFWPAIIGQFGLIGLLFYLGLLFIVFKFMFKESKYEKIGIFSILFIFICFIVASLATSVFFHPITLSVFFVIPLAFNKKEVTIQ